MGGQQIVQDAFVRLLQHGHFAFLVRRLQLPQEIEPRRPFDLAAVRQNGNHKDDDASERNRVQRNGGVDFRIVAGEYVGVRQFDEQRVNDAHEEDEHGFDDDRQAQEHGDGEEGEGGGQRDVLWKGAASVAEEVFAEIVRIVGVDERHGGGLGGR